VLEVQEGFQHMNMRFVTILCVSAAMLAACGGGGTTSTTTPSAPTVVPPVTTMPAPAAPAAPTAAPAPAGQGNIPLSEMVAGSLGYVNPATHRTLYFLDVDTPTGGTCVSTACLALWPIMAPTPGSQPSGSFTIITRSDGKGQQWAYLGHPLYMFADDTGPDQANGDNFPEFGGHWHVARGTTAAAPAAPTPAPPAPTPGPAY
jgi:predicted lipoprotein with Yx(FWY)xxD motif